MYFEVEYVTQVSITWNTVHLLVIVFLPLRFRHCNNRCKFCFASLPGQEENLYAKKNYDKYLLALKNSGLVSVEEKAQGATADVTVGAEGGAGAMVLLGNHYT